MNYLLYYLCGVNIISFIFYGFDKLLAILKKYRIKEKSLLILSIFGGVMVVY